MLADLLMAERMRLIFILRQSPDWASLAADYEAGHEIAVYRYKPDHDIPGFPKHIERQISEWNRLFGLNFFRCRHTLREISQDLLSRIAESTLTSESDLSAQVEEIVGSAPALLFYMDDDDWFAPDLQERISNLDFGTCDVAVFPFVRLGHQIATFVRANTEPYVVMGECRIFDYRYHTNNYGILSKRVPVTALSSLRDHVEASAYADRHDLSDGYFDRIISATNKTPCSASGLFDLLAVPARGIRMIRSYVERLRSFGIPKEASWLNEPVRKTADLFEQVMESTRPALRLRLKKWLRRNLT